MDRNLSNDQAIQPNQPGAAASSSDAKQKAEAQQLAIDASKLLTVTAKRWNDYKKRGFVKRCWYKFSGKQGRLDRENSHDLAEMQKLAWHYLKELQEQNQIEDKAIAVIRDNLRDVNEEIGDLYCQVSFLVDQFDKRLTDVEQVVKQHGQQLSLEHWLNHVELKKVDSRHPCLAVLQLTFSYLDVLRQNGIEYGTIADGADLNVAFRRFHLDPEQKMTIDHFITKLFAEVSGSEDAAGDSSPNARTPQERFRDFKQIVTLKVGDAELSAEYLLDKIAGTGYSALYSFVQEMDDMQHAAQHMSPDIRNSVMLETVRSFVNDANKEYSVLDLAMEILAGSLLAIDSYRSEHDVPETKSAPAEGKEGASPLNGFIPLHGHAFLGTNPSNEEKLFYLESLSLILGASNGVSIKQDGYILSLAHLFGCEGCLPQIRALANSSQRLDIHKVQTLLSTPVRKYAWLTDGIFLGTQVSATDKVQARVVEAAKVLGISEQVVTMLWEQMTILAKSAAPQEVWSAILKVRAYGFAWKTILDYRKFGFADLWAEPSRRLQDLSRELRHESWETYTALLSEWMDCSGDFNKSEFAKMPSYLSLRLKIGKYRGTIKPAIARLKPDVDMCASIVEAFGEKPACLPEWSDSFEQGASTEGWIDSLSPSMNRIDDWYSKMDAACSQLASQVKFYCEGNVCASVVALSKKEKEEARIRKEQEQQAKKEVPVSIGDKAVRLTIALTKLGNPPFNPQDIRSVVSDGAVWYVLAKGLWKSQTGTQWDRVLLPEGVVDDDLNTLAYIHGNLIVGDEYKRLIYYSGDGRAFQSASLPEDARKVVMHDGKYWYAQGFALNKYSYSKKGFLFDSHETDFYHETKLFTAEQLAGPWKSAEPNFLLPKGISIPDGALYASSGCIFAVCESMDGYLKNTGYGDSNERHIAYLIGKEAWQKGELNKEDAGKLREYSDSGSFIQAFNKIIYADTTGIYTSADGHFWQRVEVKDYRLSSPSLPSYYRLGKYLFLHESDSHAFYVSADGLTFQELLLNDSVADVAANQDSFLMAAYPDGERNLCQLFIGKLVESSQQSS